MFLRIASTLILWIFVVGAIFFKKSAGFTVVVWLLSSAAIFEICGILFKTGLRPMLFVAQICNVFVFAAAWLSGAYGENHYAGGTIAVAISAAIMSLSVIGDPFGDFPSKGFVPTLMILFCVTFMLQWLPAIAATISVPSEYTGSILATWIVAAAKFSDVGAYVIGSAFGRHKMSPNISPNKTWEGWIGGLFSAAAVSSGIAYFAESVLPENFTPMSAAIAGLAIGAAATASDLLESVLKRRACVKDSGSMIPGIGGALDLADSLILSAPTGMLALFVIL